VFMKDEASADMLELTQAKLGDVDHCTEYAMIDAPLPDGSVQ